MLLAGGGRLDERRPETFEDNACPPEFDRALASRQMASLVLSMR